MSGEPAMSEKQVKPEREGGWVVWLVVVVLLALAAGGYAGSKYYVGDKVPRGVEISGVDVGGLARADALAALEREFADRADQPIEVTVEGRSEQLRPAEIGLEIDYEATLDAAGARPGWTPARQWEFYAGGPDVDAVVAFDEDLLDTKLAALSEGLGTPPKDGEVRFRNNGRIRTVEPEDGRAIEPAAAREALGAAYLSGEGSAELNVVATTPEIDAGDVSAAVTELAEPAVAAPVTFGFGDAEVKFGKRKIARSLRMVPEDGELVLQVRRQRLLRLMADATTDGEPVDATVELVGGEPQVVPAKPGVSYDPDDVVATFLRLVQASGAARTGSIEAQVTEAEFSTEDAEALGIVEKVSEFTTYYPHSDYRNVNIGRAAELTDGTVLKPGEIFSMNDIVGERTAENGFTQGYIISNGILKQDYGGGVSQLATTLFNAMYFAGLEDVEHKPHSFYISRYPVGRESTIAWGSFDFRFRNDTEYGVLVHSYINPSTPTSQGSVTVEMYSTKVWDITSANSDRYAYTSPSTRYIQDPGCEPHEGWSGFQIDVTRTFREHGEDEVHHTETFHTVYQPSDHVVCGPTPGQDDENDENDENGGGNGGNGGGGGQNGTGEN